MNRYLALAAASVAALALPAAVHAEDAQAPACAAVPAPLPTELASWPDRAPLDAARRADRIGEATLTVGKAVDAVLARTADVKYVLRPEKPGGSVSYGGLFAFTAEQTGTFRVALGSGAWIDVVKDGKAVESTAHGHGPDCTGVRKMVDFPLEPGSYILQIAANGQAQLPLLVTRLP